jgi:hypothetical protein
MLKNPPPLRGSPPFIKEDKSSNTYRFLTTLSVASIRSKWRKKNIYLISITTMQKKSGFKTSKIRRKKANPKKGLKRNSLVFCTLVLFICSIFVRFIQIFAE